MTDLTRPDRGEAVARVGRMVTELDDPESTAGYFMVCMAILAESAPDVAQFLMDRADAALERNAAVLEQLLQGLEKDRSSSHLPTSGGTA